MTEPHRRAASLPPSEPARPTLSSRPGPMRSLLSSRSGQVGLIAALLALPLAMIVGLAIDYSRASTARDQMQVAIDGAVLAGARDASSSWTTVATRTFDAGLLADVTVSSRSFAADSDGNYAGTAQAKLKTSFGGLFSLDALSLQVTATAVRKAAGNKVCILLLSTTASPGLLLNGGANLNAPNCEVHVKSTANPAATFNSGTVFTTLKTCVAGTNVLDNGGTHASLTKGCSTATDPFAGTLPTPSTICPATAPTIPNTTTMTLQPGVYCGWFNFNGGPAVTLNPGVYVIKNGGWNVNGGSLSGSGVTFYMADTSYIQFNGTVKLDLTAPTSGTYTNLLWYEAQSLSQSSFTMNATNGARLTGLIWLPSRNLTLNAGASATSNNLTMVLNSLIMNTVNWTIGSADKAITTSGGTAASIYLKR